MFDPLFMIPIALTLPGTVYRSHRPARRATIGGGQTLTALVVLLITLRGTTPAQRVKLIAYLPDLPAALSTPTTLPSGSRARSTEP
ncbi:hypothetical protein [Spongiactinospora gelatinilytica]|nr:hypothetical protein [Spongiactinospora gelatinilytica]